MLRKSLILFISGAMVGGSSVEICHRRYARQTELFFNQRLKCKRLADTYIRDKSDDIVAIDLQKVDYSTSSNTCFAAVETTTTVGSATWRGWAVVDLLTGDEIPVGTCSEQRNCGNGQNVRFTENLEIKFKSAIDGTKPPN